MSRYTNRFAFTTFCLAIWAQTFLAQFLLDSQETRCWWPSTHEHAVRCKKIEKSRQANSIPRYSFNLHSGRGVKLTSIDSIGILRLRTPEWHAMAMWPSWLRLRLQSQSIETATESVAVPRSVLRDRCVTRLRPTFSLMQMQYAVRFPMCSVSVFAFSSFRPFAVRCACDTDGEYYSMPFRRIFIFNFHFLLVDISAALPQLKWQLMSCVQRIFIKIIYLFERSSNVGAGALWFRRWHIYFFAILRWLKVFVGRRGGAGGDSSSRHAPTSNCNAPTATTSRRNTWTLLHEKAEQLVITGRPPKRVFLTASDRRVCERVCVCCVGERAKRLCRFKTILKYRMQFILCLFTYVRATPNHSPFLPCIPCDSASFRPFFFSFRLPFKNITVHHVGVDTEIQLKTEEHIDNWR